MREYGQIQCSYWTKCAEEKWSTDATVLGAYMLTGPHSNGIGCYRLTDGYLSDDMQWSSERVSKTLSELFEKGFCKRFGSVVFIPKFVKWNPISNGNVAKARAQEFDRVPSDDAKEALAADLLEFGAHWTTEFRNRLETISKVFLERYGKQNPTQPNPTKTQPEKGPATPAAADAAPPAKPGRQKTPKHTFATFLTRCKEAGESAISEKDSAGVYAREVGLPTDYMRMAWVKFRERYTVDHPQKKYSDWRRVFHRAVEDNWLKLWVPDDGNGWKLTNLGIATQRTMKEREERRRQEEAHG